MAKLTVPYRSYVLPKIDVAHRTRTTLGPEWPCLQKLHARSFYADLGLIAWLSSEGVCFFVPGEKLHSLSTRPHTFNTEDADDGRGAHPSLLCASNLRISYSVKTLFLPGCSFLLSLQTCPLQLYTR